MVIRKGNLCIKFLLKLFNEQLIALNLFLLGTQIVSSHVAQASAAGCSFYVAEAAASALCCCCTFSYAAGHRLLVPRHQFLGIELCLLHPRVVCGVIASEAELVLTGSSLLVIDILVQHLLDLVVCWFRLGLLLLLLLLDLQ